MLRKNQCVLSMLWIVSVLLLISWQLIVNVGLYRSIRLLLRVIVGWVERKRNPTNTRCLLGFVPETKDA